MRKISAMGMTATLCGQSLAFILLTSGLSHDKQPQKCGVGLECGTGDSPSVQRGLPGEAGQAVLGQVAGRTTGWVHDD